MPIGRPTKVGVALSFIGSLTHFTVSQTQGKWSGLFHHNGACRDCSINYMSQHETDNPWFVHWSESAACSPIAHPCPAKQQDGEAVNKPVGRSVVVTRQDLLPTSRGGGSDEQVNTRTYRWMIRPSMIIMKLDQSTPSCRLNPMSDKRDTIIYETYNTLY